MSLNDILVIAAAAVVIAGLAWWFFGPEPAAETAEARGVQEIRVKVRGGYTPGRIRARPGVPVRLVFDRQESGDCTSRVVFPDLGVSAGLPAFAETAVELPALKPREYGFACGMNMIHGLLAVDGTAGGKPADGQAVPGRADAVPATAGTAMAEPGGPGAPQAVTVVVQGGYHPERVLARAGAPLRLEFDRREEGACSQHVVFPALGGGGPGLSSRPFAEATQAAIDAEVMRLLREAEEQAAGLLRAHRDELDQLTRLLLEQETVDGAAVYRIAGQPVPDEAGGQTMAPRRIAAASPAPRPAAAADPPARAARAARSGPVEP